MTPNATPLAPAASDGSRRCAGFWERMRAARQERRAIRTLNAMPERMLRDIGLNRDGIRDAVRHGRSG